MNPLYEHRLLVNRRHFFGRAATGIGGMALASLWAEHGTAAAQPASDRTTTGAVPGGLPGFPNFMPKAKRVIYLLQSGAPSQMDLFDYKPKLKDLRATELPDSIRQGQRLTRWPAPFTSEPSGASSTSSTRRSWKPTCVPAAWPCLRRPAALRSSSSIPAR